MAWCHSKVRGMLANKVVLITGAAQGIGLATARLMLLHGAKVKLNRSSAASLSFSILFDTIPRTQRGKSARVVPRILTEREAHVLAIIACFAGVNIRALQVSLADICKSVGVATCDALQREFGREVVTFIPTDVTDSMQLVSSYTSPVIF